MATISSLCAARLARAGPRPPPLAKRYGSWPRRRARRCWKRPGRWRRPRRWGPSPRWPLRPAPVSCPASSWPWWPGRWGQPCCHRALLERARTGSMCELAEEAGRARAAAARFGPGAGRSTPSRGVRQWTDPSGTWQLHAQGLARRRGQGHGRHPALCRRGLCRGAARRAATRPRRPTPIDGLVALATAGGARAPSADIMVRVDHSALVRGYADRRRGVRGGRLRARQHPGRLRHHGQRETRSYKAVVTKGKDVVGVAHLGRRPNAHQRAPWTGCSPPAPPRAAAPGPASCRPTTAPTGQDPRHGAASCWTGCVASPRPQDKPGLGAGRGQGQAALRPARTTPATPVTTWRRRRLRRREPRALGVKLRTASNGRSHRRARPAPVYRGPSQS